MTSKRTYRTFIHHEAVLRICCDKFDIVVAEIVRQRRILEEYIARDPEFKTALVPTELRTDAPEVARRMAWAARRVGVGPMAAVAGAMAQIAAEAALTAGAREAIVDNGGDIYLHADAMRIDDGALVFMQRKTDGLYDTVVVAAGSWSVVYAASVIDGSPVAVEHWDGEVVS